MTAAEWRACDEPQVMLEALRRKASDRKLRLFACAVCRGVWGEISYQRSRDAVEAAERFADGLEGEEALLRAWTLAAQVASEFGQRVTRGRLVLRDGMTPEEDRLHFAANAAHVHTPYLIGRLRRHLRGHELTDVSPPLLRCVFGDPFRPAAFPDHWRTDTAVALAAGMYESRDFAAMPILADALQDAGCGDDAVLAHCREAGAVHVRGCWVVDGVLGRG